MQICSSNNSFNKIIIPISDSNRHLVSLTADLLLSKYGIHADVVLNTDENIISGGGDAVGDAADGGGESNISFPYSLFHTFFSFDKLSDVNVSDVNVSDKPIVKPIIEPIVEPIDKPIVKPIIEPIVEPIDKPIVKDVVDDEPIADVVDDEPIADVVDDEPIAAVVDDKPIVEPIAVVVDDEPVDVKSIQITIHSIDGIRNW
jgi:hypothetical protein